MGRPERAPRPAVWLAPAAVWLGLISTSACASAPRANVAQADTLRGTVLVVGADPVTRLVLRTDDGQIGLEGPAAGPLRRAAGLGVRVDGRIADGAMTVTAFRIREADGMPAADGLLEVAGDTAVLVTPDGRLPYAPVPTALRARVGAWVWIAGPPGGEPQAWGVLGEEPPDRIL